MKTSLLLSLALCTLLITHFVGAAEKADRVLIGGVIETMNPNQPTATAVAIHGGKIIYVGNDNGAKKYIDDKTDVISLNGKYVTPGFIESHNHVVASAWTTMGVDLSGARSVDDIGRILKEHVRAHPNEKGPLIGFGWMPANIGARGPRAKDLDKWDLGRPTIAIGNAVHDAGLNTLALKAAGIDNNTPDIQPGVMYWERDENNNITGLGIEVIFFDAFIKIGAWQPERMVPESIDKLQGFLAKQGVTTAMVPGLVTPAAAVSSELLMKDMREIMPILKRRADQGEAQIRLNVMPMFKLPDADPQEFVDFTLEMKSLYDDDMVRVDKVKIHPELAWNQRGATQLVPYLPEKEGDAPTWGHYGVSPDRIFEVVNRANRNGLDVITHADGARLIKRLTEIIIEAKKQYPNARNRLDHISMMDTETRNKVVKHNIPTNATPMFVNELDAGLKGEVIFQYMPRDYIKEALSPYQELINQYDNVSLSGDTPAAPIDRAYPIYLMQQAMTNKEPSIEGSTAFPPWRPTLTIDQALHAYTVAPAWQMRMEDKIGSIEVGKYADMAIFEKNLRDIKPDNLIEEAKVVGTLLNGKFTHREDL
ncbi:amidohydrolase [Microbulbifer epialgicus]|uniref:Amidohydrolase n=1 Tax=Microbulbifer epialgicus TaxID=393907 RepID=A0ABV4P5P8_9GAMM